MRQKITGAFLALSLAVMGVLAFASPASAHTPSVTATCTTLSVSASYYETKPSTTEHVLITEATPGSPAVPPTYEERLVTPAVPGVEAVTHLEYEYTHAQDGNGHGHGNGPANRWEIDGWNANGNPQSVGWVKTGNTRVIIDVAAVEGTPAVYETVMTDPGSPEIPATDAVYEDVVTEGDATPNAIIVSYDGAVVDEISFGANHSSQYTWSDSVAHPYTVQFIAWNDPDGSKGWSKTISGTSTPCAQPPVECAPYEHEVDGECIPLCRDGVLDPETGNCVPIDLCELEGSNCIEDKCLNLDGLQIGVPNGYELINGECVAVEEPPVLCPDGQEVSNGFCVEPDPATPGEEPEEPTVKPVVDPAPVAAADYGKSLAITNGMSQGDLIALFSALAFILAFVGWKVVKHFKVRENH